jgi:hypothetical protein
MTLKTLQTIYAEEYSELIMKNIELQETIDYSNNILLRIDKFIIEKGDDHPLSNVLGEYKDSIKKNLEFLESNDFTVCFIGKVGVGKTSIICRLLGLEYENKGEYVPCLKTGSGRSTSCEVRVVNSDTTEIEIKAMSESDARETISNFADYVEIKLNEENKSKVDEKLDFPKEIQRIIRNMLGLKRRSKTNPDMALKLFKEMENKEAFINTCWDKLKYHERTKISIKFEPLTKPLFGIFGKNKTEEKEWIKNTFSAINMGTKEDVPIPECIILKQKIVSNEHDITFVDTRGLDGKTGTTRPDIFDYIEGERNICVLCSSFGDAPDLNIRQLFSDTTEMGIKDALDERVLILVADRNESKDVPDATSFEDGRIIKKEEISDELLKSRHSFNSDCIEFINVMDRSEKEESISNFIEKKIDAHINERYEKLLNFNSSSNQILLDVGSKHTTIAGKKEIHTAINVEIDRFNNQHLSCDSLHKKFIEDLHKSHASTLWGSVNRKGFFNNLNFYRMFNDKLRKLCVECYSNCYDRIEQILENYRDRDDYIDLKDYIISSIEKIREQKENFYKESGSYGDSYLGENLQHDEPFWQTQQQKWGEGIGFRSSVVNSTDIWFNDNISAVQIEDFIVKSRQGFTKTMENIKTFLFSGQIATEDENLLE